MKRASFLVLLLAQPLPVSDLSDKLKTITKEEMLSHIEILAATELAGRPTGSLGFERAAEYIELHLKRLGLEPVGPEASYRLPYPRELSRPGEATSAVWTDAGGVSHELSHDKDYTLVPGSGVGSASGPPILIGYAIANRRERWNELQRADVRGRVVFAFTREPRADDTRSRAFDAEKPTRFSELATKVKLLTDQGATGLVLIPDPGEFPSGDLPVQSLTPMLGTNRPLHEAFPVVTVSRALASLIFDIDIEAYHKRIDKRMRPEAIEPPDGTRFSFATSWETVEEGAYNLAAKIAGSDGDGEVVIYGAHLDHLGYHLRGDRGRFQLHPGADDNASGSAALLEVAEAFAELEPKEDILFLWFSGEENGLLGSRAYCDDPLYPHTKTIAMLNADMVGRGKPKECNIGGTWDHPKWKSFIAKTSRRAKSGLKVDQERGRDLYQRSDNWPFFQNGVIALFFFEGHLALNKDYHLPGDVPDRVDARKSAAMAKLLFTTGYALAVEQTRP